MFIQRYSILLQGIILTLCSHSLSAQSVENKIINQTFSIFAYSNNLEIASKFSLTNEVQERNFIRPLKQSQFSLKTQINYNFWQNWIAAAGFAYYLSSPGDPYSLSSLVVPEVRLNQDLNYKQRFSAFSIGHRGRIEERFINKSINDTLIEGYKFKERLSYTLSFEYYLLKKDKVHSLTFKASDGISIYSNKNRTNFFDQNRFYTGLNYQVEKNIYLELGYIKIFQQLSSGDRFYNRDMASVIINHKLKIKNQEHKQEL